MIVQRPAWMSAGLALLLSAAGAGGQGTFQNLDFEHPLLPLNPVNFKVPIANALPGWTGYIGSGQVDQVWYDTITLNAASISLQGVNGFIQPFQGRYSVGLESSDPGNQFMAALAQVGRIPDYAVSLLFYASPYNTLQVTFAGQAISLGRVGTGSGYDIMGGDISAFAGQTGELRFISGIGPDGQGGAGFLDNIQFSPQSIPEPSVLGLSALGALLLGWRVLERRR